MAKRIYQTVSDKEVDWLEKFDEDIQSDFRPDGSDFYGTWASCRNRDDWDKAFEIRNKMIEENLSLMHRRPEEDGA